MVIAGGDGAASIAAGVAGAASTVTAVVTTGVTVGISAAVTTAAAAAASALSFSAVAFSVPVAMHLSRYGRLPSWNKSRTQCLVIFHSSKMKGILAAAMYCDLSVCITRATGFTLKTFRDKIRL